MTNKTTSERLTEILVQQLMIPAGKERMAKDVVLADLGADSLDLLEILMAIEQEFDLSIPDDEASEIMEKVKTFGELVEYVDKLVSEK